MLGSSVLLCLYVFWHFASSSSSPYWPMRKSGIILHGGKDGMRRGFLHAAHLYPVSGEGTSRGSTAGVNPLWQGLKSGTAWQKPLGIRVRAGPAASPGTCFEGESCVWMLSRSYITLMSSENTREGCVCRKAVWITCSFQTPNKSLGRERMLGCTVQNETVLTLAALKILNLRELHCEKLG